MGFRPPTPAHPKIRNFETTYLHFVRGCVRGISCKLGEFTLGHCEDIMQLVYQKSVMPCGLPLTPVHNFEIYFLPSRVQFSPTHTL